MNAKSWDYIKTYTRRGKGGRFRKHIITPERVSLVLGIATLFFAYYIGYITHDNFKKMICEPVHFVSPVSYE